MCLDRRVTSETHPRSARMDGECVAAIADLVEIGAKEAGLWREGNSEVARCLAKVTARTKDRIVRTGRRSPCRVRSVQVMSQVGVNVASVKPSRKQENETCNGEGDVPSLFPSWRGVRTPKERDRREGNRHVPRPDRRVPSRPDDNEQDHEVNSDRERDPDPSEPRNDNEDRRQDLRDDDKPPKVGAYCVDSQGKPFVVNRADPFMKSRLRALFRPDQNHKERRWARAIVKEYGMVVVPTRIRARETDSGWSRV